MTDKRVIVIEENDIRLQTDLSSSPNPEENEEETYNPYWIEPDDHPNPELGCIRRGLCCKSSPGWFAPGEVERAIEHSGLEAEEFVRRYLIIDGMDIDGERIDVFAPVKLGRDGLPLEPTHSRATRLYSYLQGPCIFYQGSEKGCGIYETRPLECSRYICTNAPDDNLTHREIALMWKKAAEEDT